MDMEDIIVELPEEAMNPQYVVSMLSEVTDWGHKIIGAEFAQKYSQGEGVKVAVLDSGCASHVDLDENVLPGAATVAGCVDWDDKNGHGTHVAGIIAALANNIGVIGVAPKCKIVPIKVLGDNGLGNMKSIVDGVYKAIELKVDIISMSLGTYKNHPELHKAVREANDKGIIIVASAGNNPNKPITYPAAYPEVIAVSALDQSGKRAVFAAKGDELDASAPGVEVYSTYLNNQYALLSGTSQAAPYISGMCAVLLSWSRQNPDINTIGNTQEMLKMLDDLSGENQVLTKAEYGFGIPNFANYMPWKDIVNDQPCDNT